MGIDFYKDYRDKVVMVCNTSDWAFGPIIDDEEMAERFLKWLGSQDPRSMTDNELDGKFADFRVYWERLIECPQCRCEKIDPIEHKICTTCQEDNEEEEYQRRKDEEWEQHEREVEGREGVSDEEFDDLHGKEPDS